MEKKFQTLDLKSVKSDTRNPKAEKKEGFSKVFDQHNWDQITADIYNKTAIDVERALANTKRDLEDFKALISPAARPYLEQMAQLSNQLTKKRFGNTMQMYVPMYLSNESQNICTYCGLVWLTKLLKVQDNKKLYFRKEKQAFTTQRGFLYF